MRPGPTPAPNVDLRPVLCDTLSEMRRLGTSFLRSYQVSIGEAFATRRTLDPSRPRRAAPANGLGIPQPAPSAQVTSIEVQRGARRDRSPAHHRSEVVHLTPRPVDLRAPFNRAVEPVARSATEDPPRESRERNERTPHRRSRAR